MSTVSFSLFSPLSFPLPVASKDYGTLLISLRMSCRLRLRLRRGKEGVNCNLFLFGFLIANKLSIISKTIVLSNLLS